jgi:hypothetical protein
MLAWDGWHSRAAHLHIRACVLRHEVWQSEWARQRGCFESAQSLVLVRSVASSTAAPVATATATSAEAAATTPKAASPKSSASAASPAAHAGHVRTLGGDLDIAALEHAFVQDQGLGHEAGFGEFDVGIPSDHMNKLSPVPPWRLHTL